MNRIDVHCHFLPSLDDGCQSLGESLECLRLMAEAGYSRVFCTPHYGAGEFGDMPHAEIAGRVAQLQEQARVAGMGIELRPGGELRLTPHIAENLPEEKGGPGVPTYGHRGKYVLTDLWEEKWPAWANRAVQWLQKRGLTVIVAHPERMPALRDRPESIDEIAALGVLFQGNLGPIAGADSPKVVALARRFLTEGRYFMVGTDGHRTSHLPQRLAGLKVVEELVGSAKLHELTVENPSRLWG
jgi:protein-tyrosine phosphatase